MAEGEYARDLIGYGRNPPAPALARRRARRACSSCSTTRRAARTTSCMAIRASEAFLSEIVGAQPWPGQRHMNMESIYEYGSRAGFWRLWRMFTERGMPVTVFGVAMALAAQPGSGRRHAGGRMGDRLPRPQWIDYQDFSPDEEREHMREAIRIHTEVDRRAPARLVHRPHLEHTIAARGGGGRLPLHVRLLRRRPALLGSHGPNGRSSIVPYTLDANDMRFATPQGFNSGDQFFTYLKDSFDVLYAEGETAPEDDVGRPALPARRPARAAPRRSRAFSTTSRARAVWVARRDRHRPPLDGASPARSGHGFRRSTVREVA